MPSPTLFSRIHHYIMSEYSTSPSQAEKYAQHFWALVNQCLMTGSVEYKNEFHFTRFGDLVKDLLKNDLTSKTITAYYHFLNEQVNDALTHSENLAFYDWFLLQIGLPIFIENTNLSLRAFNAFALMIPKGLISETAHIETKTIHLSHIKLLLLLSNEDIFAIITRFIHLIEHWNLKENCNTIYFQIGIVLKNLDNADIVSQMPALEAAILQILLLSKYSHSRKLAKQAVEKKRHDTSLMFALFPVSFIKKLVDLKEKKVVELFQEVMLANKELRNKFFTMDINIFVAHLYPELWITCIVDREKHFIENHQETDFKRDMQVLQDREKQKPKYALESSVRRYLLNFFMHFYSYLKQPNTEALTKLLLLCCQVGDQSANRRVFLAESLMNYIELRNDAYGKHPVLLECDRILRSYLPKVVTHSSLYQQSPAKSSAASPSLPTPT